MENERNKRPTYTWQGLVIGVPFLVSCLLTGLYAQPASDLFEQAIQAQYEGKNDEALALQLHVLSVFSEEGNGKGKVDALNQIGFLYYKWGQFDTARAYFLQADSLANQISYIRGKAESLKNLAKHAHSHSEFPLSIRYNLQADSLASLEQDTSLLLLIRKNLGDDYESQGDYVRALNTYLSAEPIAKRSADTLALSAVYSHLGNLYLLLGNLDSAQVSHERALDLRTQQDFPEGISKSLQNLGLVWIEMGEIKRAEILLRKSLALSREIGYRKGQIKCLNSLGQIAQLEDRTDEAVSLHQRALTLSRELAYDKGIILALNQLGELFFKKGKYHKAAFHFSEACELAQQASLKMQERNALLGLYQLAKQQGETDNALRYFEAYHEREQELLGQEQSRSLAEVQIRYETARKERENELLRRENELQQLSLSQSERITLLLLIAATLFLGLTLALYGRFRQQRKSARELASLNHQLNQSHAEKDQFFAIIAHELRSPLWWFRNLASILSRNFRSLPPERLEKAILSIDESAKNAFHLMDNLLQWSRTQLNRLTLQPERVSLQGLLDEVIGPMGTAIDQKKIAISYQIPTEASLFVDPETIKVVVRNLLSNALKYTPFEGNISLSAYASNGGWELQVQDDGVGMNEEQIQALFDPSRTYTTLGISQEKGSGLGLILCQEFVLRNKGRITVESQEGEGTRFQVWLPGEA